MARPNLSYLKNVLLTLTGIPLGIITGMTGCASSAISIPLLGFLIGQRGPRAIATALTVNTVAAVAALLAYSQHGYVAWLPAMLLVVTQIMGTAQAQRWRMARAAETQPAGTPAPADPPRPSARHAWLSALVAVAVGVAMAFVGVSKHVTIHGVDDLRLPPGPVPHLGLREYLLIAAIGWVVGAISQYLDLGGLLVVPALVFSIPFAPHWAQALALVSLALTGIPVALAHATSGLLETRSSFWLSAGALFGALVGAMYATMHFNGGLLLVITGGLLCVVGVVRYVQTDPATNP